MKEIWELDYRDKLLHKHMSFARNQLKKVSRLIKDYKQDSEWQEHAKEAAEAAEYLTNWMETVRKE